MDGEAYSVDLRRRVVVAIGAGMSRNKAARQFGSAISTAIGWMRRVEQTGSVPCGDGRRVAPQVDRRGSPGRWKTMTILAALRHDRIDAPWFIEGPIDGESSRTCVERVLLPTLRPGDIVVLDNFGNHRGKAVRQLIRSAGAKLFFLPKYSRDLNPIEQVLPNSSIPSLAWRRAILDELHDVTRMLCGGTVSALVMPSF